jgi:hypothetical protein
MTMTAPVPDGGSGSDDRHPRRRYRTLPGDDRFRRTPFDFCLGRQFSVLAQSAVFRLPLSLSRVQAFPFHLLRTIGSTSGVKLYLKPTHYTEGWTAMDSIEVAPDPPPPAYLAIPFDAESVLPKRSLSVTELLQYDFPNLSQVPHEDAGIPVWSEAPPHDVTATLLLSCVVPRWETVKWLLLDVRRLASAPRSFSRASVLSSEVLPNHLPIWVLSFWDRLSEAYDACLSWRRSLGWVDTL